VVVFKRRKPEEPSAGEIAPSSEPGLFIPPGPAQPMQPNPYQTAKPGDAGLGTPPFRPAPSKEANSMSRPPLPAPQAPMPSARAGSVARQQGREPAERRTLVVGRGISVQGTVTDAERLVVEGNVEATLIHANELSVAFGGVFKGEVEVEDAEVAGTMDGTLVARGNLVVRASGRLLGVARCRRLQVEDGGQITGRIEMITEPRSEAVRPVEQTF